ncbi:MAG TPA: M18 family aminopeptidase [Candidatus Cloacimonadota bacterium]|nr:M18 family aminopeptidase [Candidatus Cloacimonadota bacterium]HQL14199.1 M18 family aminopeptidase [Candidatus Cloacimonadota bacterium]
MRKPHLKSFMQFLDASPTSYQAAENIKNALQENGFKELKETEIWQLKQGKKYFVVRDDSAVVAFITGNKLPHQTGYKMAAAHLDSPGLKIKPESEKQDYNNLRIFVEIYGFPIVSSWIDRELSIAGRIIVKTKNSAKDKSHSLQSIPVNFKKPIAIIPNAAFHLNRKLNNGFEYNAQNHLPAILQASLNEDKKYTFKDIVAEFSGQKADSIIGMDLFLYDPKPACIVGIDGEMLVSGRLDNLGMSHAILSSILESEAADALQMAVFFDNEEIGSTTPQGADSVFLSNILQRIAFALGLTPEQNMIALRKSFLISADMAQAVNPNYADLHDPAYQPLLNHGPVIKMNAHQNYATNAASSAYFEEICQAANIPYQKIINRSDMPSGITIGPITAAKLGVNTVDIGNPMWAMHSIRETMGVYDNEFLIQALQHFYTK